jgi:hypothetical protein
MGDSSFGSTELGVRSRTELPGHNPCVSIHSCALELPLATVCIEHQQHSDDALLTIFAPIYFHAHDRHYHHHSIMLLSLDS